MLKHALKIYYHFIYEKTRRIKFFFCGNYLVQCHSLGLYLIDPRILLLRHFNTLNLLASYKVVKRIMKLLKLSRVEQGRE